MRGWCSDTITFNRSTGDPNMQQRLRIQLLALISHLLFGIYLKRVLSIGGESELAWCLAHDKWSIMMIIHN